MAGLLREHARVSRETKLEPLVRIATFILDFECVHPFADGNGRLGRLLTLLLLYQAGYEVGRYISLERIVEESKALGEDLHPVRDEEETRQPSIRGQAPVVESGHERLAGAGSTG